MGQMLHTRGRLTATREKEKNFKKFKKFGFDSCVAPADLWRPAKLCGHRLA